MITERICDTTQVMDDSTSDSFLCIDVPRYKCRTEIKQLHDESCKTSYRFDCHFPTDGSGYGNGNLNHLYPEKRFRYNPPIPAPWNLDEKFGNGYRSYGGYGGYDDGGDITEQKAWRRNLAGISQDQSWRRSHRGEITEEESWRKNHGGELMEAKS